MSYYQETNIPITIVKTKKRIIRERNQKMKAGLKRTVVFALGFTFLLGQSFVMSAFEAHIINITARIVDDMPIPNPTPGQYCSVSVDLSVDLQGADIWYTLDGTNPVCYGNGQEYLGSINMPIGTIILKARSCHDGKQSSIVAWVYDVGPMYCEMTCEQAIESGLLYGSISGGQATVNNDSNFPYEVGLAVYKKYDEVIDNQLIYDFDSGIVGPMSTLNLEVDLPSCRYQIDLFCGPILYSLDGVRYNDRKLAWEHLGGPEYCQPDTCMKVNEVYYDPDATHQGPPNEKKYEWVELYNSCQQDTINIQGWYLKDASGRKEYINGTHLIGPHEFVVIAPTDLVWTMYWPDTPANAIKIALGGDRLFDGLSNMGDRVVLYDHNRKKIDAVSWGSDHYAFSPPVSDVAEGHSIARITAGVDTDTALDWEDLSTPNPGTNPHSYSPLIEQPLFTVALQSSMPAPEPEPEPEQPSDEEPAIVENQESEQETESNEPAATEEPSSEQDTEPESLQASSDEQDLDEQEETESDVTNETEETEETNVTPEPADEPESTQEDETTTDTEAESEEATDDDETETTEVTEETEAAGDTSEQTEEPDIASDSSDQTSESSDSEQVDESAPETSETETNDEPALPDTEPAIDTGGQEETSAPAPTETGDDEGAAEGGQETNDTTQETSTDSDTTSNDSEI